MYFTYKQFHKICKEAISCKKTICANEILNNSHQENDWIIFKHDVETNVKRAIKMALIENQYGIKATYYVQGYLLKKNRELLKKIADLGHEVTYHYDVLDANGGDYKQAKEEFLNYKNEFEKQGFLIKTVCPHGNPLMNRKGWNSNKDFFRNNDISKEFNEILDIVVHLPKLLTLGYTYISDAGFQFKIITNVENNDITNKGDIEIKSLKDFRDIINNNKKIIFSTHPHRWRSLSISFLANKYKFILIKNIALILSKNKLIKKLISKFYFLAKKV